MNRTIQRLIIVNRGEPAMRLIHAVREFNQEHGQSIKTIALYTDPDAQSMFVREADEAYHLGEATFVDPVDGERKSSYLDYERLERAIVETRVDAAWVGWGFVAERPEFVDLCNTLGVTFLGPSAAVMRALGDKITSKRIAEDAKVPVAPWSGGPVETLAEAQSHASRLGFPLMIKATAGGGGRGIRKIRSMDELEEAFERARSEALKSFGDATVFMERMVQGAHHVEVQIIADRHGNVWAAGVRDCSVQRRNQKVIEESGSPVLTSFRHRKLRESAVRLCKTAGYTGAGTVEFLYDPKAREFAFMEVNARLQVEHPVTEETTGLDLVKLQILVAQGGQLEGRPPRAEGCAIEVRLNAEDPDNGFAPAPGLVELFRLPTGPGVRVDTGVEEGDRIAPDFDSMVAKIIAKGKDRNEALARLRRALTESTIIVRGGTTNKAFLLELLDEPEIIEGRADITWLDRLMAQGSRGARLLGELAIIQAAIEVYKTELEGERQTLIYTAYRGRPEVSSTIGRKVELRYLGETYTAVVYCVGPSHYRVEIDGNRIDVHDESLGRFERRMTVRGETFRIVTMADGVEQLVEVDGIPHRVSRDDGGTIRSSAPAVVVSIKVEPGQEVQTGETVAVLEAMKTEMPVAAPVAGTVREIMTSANEQVAAGAPLLKIEPSGDGSSQGGGPHFDFARFDGTPDEGAEPVDVSRSTLRELRRMVRGYDVNPKTTQRLVNLREEAAVDSAADDAGILAEEDRLLASFADIATLSGRDPLPVEGSDSSHGHSPQQWFFTYLRSLDGEGEGLPQAFQGALRRALGHYGIEELERSSDLETALLRILKSHSRTEHQLGPVVSILERRLRDSAQLRAHTDAAFGELLKRLTRVCRNRFPALEDLVREVRYEYFDKPLLDRARHEVYATALDDLQHLARFPDSGERKQRLEALVTCPQPLMSLFSEHYAGADLAMRQLILECLVRRYYYYRPLENVRVLSIEGHSMALADYEHDNERFHVIATLVTSDKLETLSSRLEGLLRDAPESTKIVLDLYVRREEGKGETLEDLRESMERAVNALSLPRRLHRVVTVVTGQPSADGHGQSHFTFRFRDEGYREDRLLRGLHPMMAKRLDLWRLSNFLLERVPSSEDVYIFRGVAEENARDERLFALAEVRDLSPRRDKSGEIVGLPHLERMFLETLAGIRRVQSTRPAHKRLYWNRVILFAWPELDLSPNEIQTISRRLAAATAGLGLEKVVVRARMRTPGAAEPEWGELHISAPAGRGVRVKQYEPSNIPIRPLTPYRQKVVKMQQRGLHYPYEIVRMLTPQSEDGETEFPKGRFEEYDIGPTGRLEPVEREWGKNDANIVTGVISNVTDKHPEGMKRVMVLGDPSRALGSLAEPECRRILGAIDLADEMGVPVEWFAVSAGAKISMESGTENMDWIAMVLRRIILFTQKGGEINVIVTGVNVGAQPYWNAEATMLMHTRGILVMSPESAMVLTGKKALDYSGSVSAEDNFGIGGFDRVMGPNGQAQYWADDVTDACRILLRHYEHTYLAPGERFPRSVKTEDPVDRDVCAHPYQGDPNAGFETIGEVFSPETNPGRKRPFEIRRVMRAVMDADHTPLERWSAMADAEVAVVWDAHLGGHPVCMLGLESRPLRRAGLVPADGPESWTAGTLFPKSSKKVARALNAASGNRPVVVLANLSGFDGSPESMRQLQLEYGAEIGRAIVNFRGPIVFTVISRYHGGAFVVFSRALNESMEVSALQHTYASVIGGAPAAAVVFARDVDARTKNDPRIRALEEEIAGQSGARAARSRAKLAELYKAVRSEKLGEVSSEFDGIHSVERALRVGSISDIVDPQRLRPYLVESIERGMKIALSKPSYDEPDMPDWTKPNPLIRGEEGEDESEGDRLSERGGDPPAPKRVAGSD